MLFLLLLFVFIFSSSWPWTTHGQQTSDLVLYNSFLQCFIKNSGNQIQSSNIIFSPTNSSYSSVLQAYIRNTRFNSSYTSKPKIIITPLLESHVSAAVICTKNLGFQLKIRSGGHDFEGLSYISTRPFFILDMFNLRSISINLEEEYAWVGAGATLGELYYAISQKSKLHGFPGGVCPTVGIGGHISGGGYGTLLRKYGLSVDNVLDAKIVDVSGKILYRKGMGEDLFWAIRGGGGASFGVVLSYKIKIVPITETVTVFTIQRDLDQNTTDVVFQWQSIAPKTDDNLFLRMVLQVVTKKGQTQTRKTIRASISGLYLGNADKIVALMGKDFPELGLKKIDCLEMEWIESVVWWANLEQGATPAALVNRHNYIAHSSKRKSDYVETPISRNGLEGLWKKMTEFEKPVMVFNPYGGKMDEIKATDSPVPHRAGNLFKIQYSVTWKNGADEKRYLSMLDNLHSYMTPFVSKNPRRAFFPYRDIDNGINKMGTYQEGKVYGIKYYNDNFERLVDVKTANDPHNFFWNEQSIPPRTGKGKA